MMESAMTDPAKLLLLAALLAKDRIISNNAKSFLKELILRRDARLVDLLKKFEAKSTGDTTFLENIHDLIEDESQALYNELFSDTTLEMGKMLSKEERDRRSLNEEKSLIYGEVEYKSFYRVLRKINAPPGGVFYDLGSGTGKAVFAARLTQDFQRCVGIEILNGLHSQGKVVLDRYNKSVRSYLCSGQSQLVALYEGSLLEYDWSDGDFVFANSTCFDDDLMIDMAELAKNLKPGAYFVTFTKGLDSPYFEVLERKRYRMSWGPATVFIHRRLGTDGRPVGPAKLNILPSDSKTYDYDDDDMPQDDEDEEDDNNNDGNDDDEEEDVDEDDDDDEEEEEVVGRVGNLTQGNGNAITAVKKLMSIEPVDPELEFDLGSNEEDEDEDEDNLDNDIEEDEDEEDDDDDDEVAIGDISAWRNRPMISQLTNATAASTTGNGTYSSALHQPISSRRGYSHLQHTTATGNPRSQMMHSPQDSALLRRKTARPIHR